MFHSLMDYHHQQFVSFGRPKKLVHFDIKQRKILNHHHDTSPRPKKDQLQEVTKRSVQRFEEISVWRRKVLTFVGFLTLQAVVSSGNYSGFQKPPIFGDFEAQRHWMEITISLPITEWYVNSTHNDLNYWGLDYPPLTAYHSWALGKISNWINSTWLELHTSRGIEQPKHKLFMRLSVILTMSIIYAPVIFTLFCRNISAKNTAEENTRHAFQLLAALIYPGLIFVDNGHFQYNHVALGLFLWSVHLFETRRYLVGSMFFVLALNFKQMELYHALPIFVFLLSRSFVSILYKSDRDGALSKRFLISVWNVVKIGGIVLATFLALWWPFLRSAGLALGVLRRLFPLYRGVFEDKVANFWCCISVVFKAKERFSNDSLAIVSTLTVLGATLPSLYVLLRRCSERNFRLCLVISSLSFYLFSFQVHEKSILQVAIPTLLLLKEHPRAVHWFLSASIFSLYPLCIKDDMPEILPLFITYYFFLNFATRYRRPNSDSETVKLFKAANFFVALVICACQLFISPPYRYPHLFELMNAEFSFIHFLSFFFYLNYYLYDVNKDGGVKLKSA